MPSNHLGIYDAEYFEGGDQGFGYVDYDRDKLAMVSTFDRYLDRIDAAQTSRGRLLDVGAATGFFLDLARKRGWQVTGVEPSAHAAAMGRAKGIDVTTGILDDCDFPENSFDAITLWDVIEHVPEPMSTLRKVNRLLKPSGVLAINTPDSSSLVATLMGMKWHLIVPPEHLNLFHKKSLRRAVEASSFTILSEEKVGKRFTIQYVVQMLNHWTQMKLWRESAEFLRTRALGQWGVPINLRDNMFLLARKTATIP
jgi:2-polyprenyl-3-methyl-5-hydroxy-6-metoxy-1,4-benzoquinol methylase